MECQSPDLTVVPSPLSNSPSGSPTGQSVAGGSNVDSRINIPIPVELEVQARLQQVAHVVANQNQPTSSGTIYKKVHFEWRAYCTYLSETGRNRSAYVEHMDANKVFNFMFYQVFRDQKRRGGTKGGGLGACSPHDYEHVISTYSSYMNGQEGRIPDPEKPIGKAAIAQYRAALRKLHIWQVASNVTSLSWDFVFTDQSRNLVTISDKRAARKKKENYEEKVTKMFTPYQAVEQFDVIENEMWDRAKRNTRSTGSWLRNRYVFLHTTAGILRCESLYRAELSDFVGIYVKKETDVHPIFIMITQIPEGKYTH